MPSSSLFSLYFEHIFEEITCLHGDIFSEKDKNKKTFLGGHICPQEAEEEDIVPEGKEEQGVICKIAFVCS